MDTGLMGTLSKWLCFLMLCASTAALAQPDSGQRRKYVWQGSRLVLMREDVVKMPE